MPDNKPSKKIVETETLWQIKEKACMLDLLLAISEASSLQKDQYPRVMADVLEKARDFVKKRYSL